MPKYRYKCLSCQNEEQLYAAVDKVVMPCSKCSAEMERQMPRISSPQVTEIVDSLTGVTWKQDQKEILKKRRDDHYWEVEVPRFIQTYSVETCVAEGWLVYNDKGELVINKPPSKR